MSYRRLSSLLCVASLCFGYGLLAQSDPNAPGLSPAQRDAIIRRQEQIWNTDSLPDARQPDPGTEATRDEGTVTRALRRIVNTYEFSRTPSVLHFEDVALRVEPGTFPGRRPVRIELIHLRRPGDFALAGIELAVEMQGRSVPLESSGMFHVAFFDDDGIPVEPTRPIGVALPAAGDPTGARVYYLAEERWVERAPAPSSAREAGFPEEAAREESPFLEEGNPEAEGILNEGPVTPPMSELLYTTIDFSGWWNFDCPKPEGTCLSGTVSNPNATVYVAGVSYLGLSETRPDASGRFELNAMKDARVLVYAVAGDYSTEGFILSGIGALPVFLSQNVTTHTTHSQPRCQDLGRLSLSPGPTDLLQDRERFLQAIGMPD